MFNIQQMMQKAQVMQKKMAELQEGLSGVEVSGSAGGGLVQVVMTCKGTMRSILIDPSLIVATEKDMLEDMVKAACNDARAKADQKMAEETQKAMADMGLPPGMLGSGGLPF
jgi:DNA-binding YbaB/EbfC family protein